MSWPVFPAIDPTSYSLALRARTQTGGTSPLDGTTQTLELPGACWVAELKFENLFEGEWRALAAFVASLGGRAGRFLWSPPAQPRLATAIGGLVSGGGQLGRGLRTRGWSGGAWAALAGDFIGFVGNTGRPEIHQVVGNAGAGEGAVIQIAPPIRRPPADGAALSLISPQAVFMLVDDENPFLFEGSTVQASVGLRIQEAIF